MFAAFKPKYVGPVQRETCHKGSAGPRRPEMKFDGLPALMARIRQDIGIAKAQLAEAPLREFAQSDFFALDSRP